MSESILNRREEQKTTTSPERAIAAFVGAAVGDALGWPFEGRAAGKLDVRQWDGQFVDWKKRSGSRFSPRWERIDAGAYSDDTQLILAISRARSTKQHWWEHFARVELPFWTCYERGGGGATKRAANSWLAGVAPWDSKAKDVAKRYLEAGGNGAAMRVLPHCVSHARDDDFSALAKDILADGVTTHGHPRALVGALAFGYILWNAFKRVDTLDYGSLLRRCVEETSVWGALPDISLQWPSWLPATRKHVQDFDGLWHLTVDEIVSLCHLAMDGLEAGVLSDDMVVMKALGGLSPKTNGAGTTTAVAALYYASRYAASPLEGMRCAAASEGADTDTLASMTASLLGVINGMSWLQDYEDKLQDADYIQQTAKHLVFMRKTAATSNQVTKRDLTEFKDQLGGKEAPSGLPMPIGLRVTSVERRHEQLGERVFETRVVATDAGLTLFIPSGAAKKAENPRGMAPKGKILEGAVRKLDVSAESPPHSESDFEPVIGMSLLVRDLSKSRAFYEGFLGLKVTGASQRVVRFSSTLALREDANARLSCDGVKLFVNVSDVSSCADRLARAGIESSEIVVRGNTRSFECRDPAGYAIEVFERLNAHTTN
ncbi:ADP-ribosyl-[dinitrogen reductase] glycohydrolase [Burkholderia pseudomallei]|uniref:ADP-ribosylglycohydrolase family protein n=1 Tax=Burkholderia thailandensis TaxID=57975 RepID=UPI00148EDCFB|nr:ADP-ribosylglycohydrolase family protein [Burkholderia thailandensis]CAJ3983305.1 ADP-ribosyl-[dinitrogen reductase] glycohydrolase [Burkholderia pseudomallei]CAJ9914828.1 ADP-ribosyl-[dinitrogen reductase] glycohydrolase [Burkholderia pseudomallei]CAK0425465.1 ADP-ribosyl-[dinitrogen reductase] glycohydrolase [Burkholderia pseudomallei]